MLISKIYHGKKYKLNKKKNIFFFLNYFSKNSPNKIAVQDKLKKLSYKELMEAISKLSSNFSFKNKRIGVICDRNCNLVLVILSIILSGNIYVPLKKKLNNKELKKLSNISNIDYLVCDKKNYKKSLNYVCKTFIIEDLLNISKKNKNLQSHSFDRSIYIMHTSGSTGDPKGVQITELSLMNKLLNMKMYLNLSSKDKFIFKTPYTFDVSLWEIFLFLICGSSLYVCEDGEEKNPKRINSIINYYKITIIHFVPTMLDVYQIYNFQYPVSLKKLVCSGEELNSNTVKKFYKLSNNTKLYNFYGPTEATIDIIFSEIKKGLKKIPIGAIGMNNSAFLLKKRHNDKYGELCLFGNQIMKGYTNKNLDKSCLFRNSFITHHKIYKTGDICTIKKGFFYFIGRNDNQIKLYGERFELDEIINFLYQKKLTKFCKIVKKEGKFILYIYDKNKITKKKIMVLLNNKFKKYILNLKIIFLKKINISDSGKFNG